MLREEYERTRELPKELVFRGERIDAQAVCELWNRIPREELMGRVSGGAAMFAGEELRFQGNVVDVHAADATWGCHTGNAAQTGAS